MGSDEDTLSDHIGRTQESDIEPARPMDREGKQIIRKNPVRKASEDKAPWKGDGEIDSLWDMELDYYPHAETTPWNFKDFPIIEDFYQNPPFVDGYAQPWFRWGGTPEDADIPEGIGAYVTGCVISMPSHVTNCYQPIFGKFVIKPTAVTSIKVYGAAKLLSYNAETNVIAIMPLFKDARWVGIFTDTVKVVATGMTLLGGKKYYGECEATIAFSCTDCWVYLGYLTPAGAGVLCGPSNATGCRSDPFDFNLIIGDSRWSPMAGKCRDTYNLATWTPGSLPAPPGYTPHTFALANGCGGCGAGCYAGMGVRYWEWACED